MAKVLRFNTHIISAIACKYQVFWRILYINCVSIDSLAEYTFCQIISNQPYI